MTFKDLKKKIKESYAGAFALESYFKHKNRKHLEFIFRILTILGIGVSSTLYISEVLLSGVDFTAFAPQVFGVTSIVSVIWAILFLFECFYYSYYFKEVPKGDFYIDYDLAFAIHSIRSDDIVSEFFRTSLGWTVLIRAGIKSSDFSAFLNQRKSILEAKSLDFTLNNNSLDLKTFCSTLVKADKDFQQFLFTYGIQEKELAGICEWIVELNDSVTESERWWSSENLSRIQGIGQNWSYGQIYILERYSRPIVSGLSRHYRVHSSYGVKELIELEAVLSRTRDANVLLVGNDEAGKLQIVSHMVQMINEGSVTARLKNKRVILLNNEELVSRNGTKSSFETEFIQIMKQAISAGNIIIVIDDLAGLVSSAGAFGVDLPSLFEPYLSSQNLQVVALSDTERFHSSIQKNPIFAQHFENVLIKEIDDTNTIKVLENELVRFERGGLFFTYQALLTIVDGAERYFPEGVMPDKAIDLLLEIAPKLISQGKSLVEKTDVLSLIETKTGIPVGEVKEVEKEKLLNLESILHKSIVGQDEAINTISNAVRRARSGITSPNRPLGSFLFLGPTGVGKTETTKALAEVFFGQNAQILRLDMSEYSAYDSVSKLIGSFESKQEGVLSSMLREHQYGVLLLDEFEKTTKEVMNLFLQILDEGFFSDGAGKKVMARNLIIIATSNAGSDLIWDSVKNGEDLAKTKDKIIDSIVKSGVLKPELLNRFDGVVVFHPLTETHLRKIAELMLERLHDRLSRNGINLVINENLLNYVVSFGTDPKFGARPMNRAIQEKVEEIIAKKIIAGSISKGSPVELSSEELV